jgi:hypothetical protein
MQIKLILRNVCLYKQPNVSMTLEHIMQTRSTQSILKRVFGFNCFKFSWAYSETGKLLNKPRMLWIITTLDVLKSSLYELGFQTDICGGYDNHNIARYVNSYYFSF